MPHFKAFGMMNLQYEISICCKIHNKGKMSQWQIQVTIFLSGTEFTELNLKKDWAGVIDFIIKIGQRDKEAFRARSNQVL